MPTSYGRIGQKYHFFVDFYVKIRYINSMNNKKTKDNIMKKVLEYMTIGMSVIGTFCMIGAVGSIEVDKYLQGASMTMLGIAHELVHAIPRTLSLYILYI